VVASVRAVPAIGRAFALRFVLVETKPVSPAPRAAGTANAGNCPTGVGFMAFGCFLVRRRPDAVSASP
jgi:hypothetical protein